MHWCFYEQNDELKYNAKHYGLHCTKYGLGSKYVKTKTKKSMEIKV